MIHDTHTPTASRSTQRISRFVMVLTSAAFVSGAIALPASAAVTHQSPSSVSSNGLVCPPGYVYRYHDLGPDGCEPEAENPNRKAGGGASGPDTCKPGYVWRDSYVGDHLCVRPEDRQAVHDAKTKNRQPGGGASGPDTCKPGYVWRDSYAGDHLCVTPEDRQAAHDANPNLQPGGGASGPDTCKPGYVWRDSYVGDHLCVTPAERGQPRT
ncbi:hypothetical protein ACFCYI_08505 [Streptomyces sp. NPDC056257]|uniref:hypothetical protein n=1 Tax=Streptomyces sp. NPDC056257 TaxID=3345765 RepID=UPI0035E317EA